MSRYIESLDLDVLRANEEVEVVKAKAKRLLEALNEAYSSDSDFVSPYTEQHAATRKASAIRRGTEEAEIIISLNRSLGNGQHD